MSQVPQMFLSATASPHGVGGGAADASASGSVSEKNATTPGAEVLTPAGSSSTTPAAAPAPKKRSCVTCRTRKVRCDKLSPCSNCRRAKIDCIFPSGDRPPRWARRLERMNQAQAQAQAQGQPPQNASDPGASQVMERLRTLESLVKELSGQLEVAHSANANSPATQANSPASSVQAREPDHPTAEASTSAPTGVQKLFGRLVLNDGSKSRYVGSGFWSRVTDEINDLKMDTQELADEDSELSGDEASPGKSLSTQELDRTPAERHAFLFRQNLGPAGPELSELRPLPSQVPFLLSVYQENVNQICQIVHMPTIQKMMHSRRTNQTQALSPANEALTFAIYYAAVTSMEEDDVMQNFGTSKAELNIKYRMGLEIALAKADFLNVPDIILVQTFVIFLLLVRRHDSPRYVWMMTGLVIRMAHALGLQRDGSHFPNLTPFDVEIRRRVWWILCAVDVRASEDQGTELTLTPSSSDTRLPLNINDEDISPDSTAAIPKEREGVTDMTFALVNMRICDITRRMVTPDSQGRIPSLDETGKLLSQIWENFDEVYLRHSDGLKDIKYWVGINISKLVMSKMTLIVNLPVLFSSPSADFSAEMRTKLFIAAIEVAEYNHALNAETTCRQWRWLYQTYTHWHAIVYMLIEITRRPWSSTVERAWVALHSIWLIPQQSNMSKNLRVWIPLRKLMSKARKHREAEVKRLQENSLAARHVEAEDANTPQPQSSGPFPASDSVAQFQERWRRLVGLAHDGPSPLQSSSSPASFHSMATANPIVTNQPGFPPATAHATGDPIFQTEIHSAFGGVSGSIASSGYSPMPFGSGLPSTMPGSIENVTTAPLDPASLASVSPGSWPDARSLGPNFTPWLWADSDPSNNVYGNVEAPDLDVNMDLENEVDWYGWVESAKGEESAWDAGRGGPAGGPAWSQ